MKWGKKSDELRGKNVCYVDHMFILWVSTEQCELNLNAWTDQITYEDLMRLRCVCVGGAIHRAKSSLWRRWVCEDINIACNISGGRELPQLHKASKISTTIPPWYDIPSRCSSEQPPVHLLAMHWAITRCWLPFWWDFKGKKRFLKRINI